MKKDDILTELFDTLALSTMPLENLEDRLEALRRHLEEKLDVAGYIHIHESKVQLEGWFTPGKLRQIADVVEEFTKRSEAQNKDDS